MPNERQIDVIKMRASGLTFAEIGKHFGLSLERARQIYRKGVRIAQHKALGEGGLALEPNLYSDPKRVVELMQKYQRG